MRGKTAYDLVILDIYIGLSGVDVANKVREHNKDIYVLCFVPSAMNLQMKVMM